MFSLATCSQRKAWFHTPERPPSTAAVSSRVFFLSILQMCRYEAVGVEYLYRCNAVCIIVAPVYLQVMCAGIPEYRPKP